MKVSKREWLKQVREILDDLFAEGWTDGHAYGRDERSLSTDEQDAIIDAAIKKIDALVSIPRTIPRPGPITNDDAASAPTETRAGVTMREQE